MEATIKKFLEYSFDGKRKGKYYTTEQGAKNYRNTIFQNFANKNPEFLKVLETGNDAPRGGKTGNFVIVQFSAKFMKIAKQFKNDEEEKQRLINEAKENKKLEISKIANLIDPIYPETFKETQDRLASVLTEKIQSDIFFAAIKEIRSRHGKQ